MFFLLALTVLYFPCYVELSLDFFNNEKENPEDFSKHIVSDGQM